MRRGVSALGSCFGLDAFEREGKKGGSFSILMWDVRVSVTLALAFCGWDGDDVHASPM